MSSERLLRLMLRLEGARRVTASRLADEFGVSVRTVYRDVAALSAAGVPIVTESGHGGGVRVLDGWHSGLSGLTSDETTALMLLGVPGLARELGLDAESAGRKLLGVLPITVRENAAGIGARIHVDVPGWFHRDDAVPALRPLVSAVLGGRRVRMRYRTREARVVDPLGLVTKAGTWYLVAASGGRVLSYRVSRIVSVTETDEPATRPDDFDLAAWWRDATVRFDRALLRYTCTVRLSPTGVRRLADVVGTEAASAVPGATGATGPSTPEWTAEWTTAELRLEAEDVAAWQLAQLPGHVEVLAPRSLREAVGAYAVAAAELNSPPLTEPSASSCADR
ncbi:WYL domain-containing protein [Rhodococcus rhodnii]|uniref:Transcriptional regulator n=2 Tax=Rhodococcus rhodnii TaxID=38312 RepID=R7WSP2_9NOCA|nr:WYL domain-containing protein [Rhodococcus rhodnii]EOM77129.1 transcriptional regulator [Rhodococcus rhodnii LMG 5362]TXG92122.1 WYL domain-containing protein [Rhodococcus rhodnii]